jgi:hypothetical protein
MRSYWVKIVFGALAIFLVGYLGVTVVRKQVNRVRAFSQSSDPISIPLAFIPFQLDGNKAGTFSGIRIMRDAPKSVSAFHIRVKLSDSVDIERLKSCRLYLEQTGHDFDPDDAFTCLAPDTSDSGLVEFGDVTFTAREGVEFTVPLLLDSRTVLELRSSSNPDEVAARAVAEGEAAAARAEVDRIRVEVRREVDRATAEARRRAPAAPKPPSPPQ